MTGNTDGSFDLTTVLCHVKLILTFCTQRIGAGDFYNTLRSRFWGYPRLVKKIKEEVIPHMEAVDKLYAKQSSDQPRMSPPDIADAIHTLTTEDVSPTAITVEIPIIVHSSTGRDSECADGAGSIGKQLIAGEPERRQTLFMGLRQDPLETGPSRLQLPRMLELGLALASADTSRDLYALPITAFSRKGKGREGTSKNADFGISRSEENLYTQALSGALVSSLGDGSQSISLSTFLGTSILKADTVMGETCRANEEIADQIGPLHPFMLTSHAISDNTNEEGLQNLGNEDTGDAAADVDQRGEISLGGKLDVKPDA